MWPFPTASASTAGSRRGRWSNPSTIRCWPRSSSTARTGRRHRGPAPGAGPVLAWPASPPTSTTCGHRRVRPVRSGDVSTTALNGFRLRAGWVEVMPPARNRACRNCPGRLGLWHVGVPPSGPMDARSHRNANRLVGNPPDTAALELTMTGPTLRFLSAARVALAGARMRMTLDGVARAGPRGRRAGRRRAGHRRIDGPGSAPIWRSGGFAAPQVLGSRATFGLGGSAAMRRARCAPAMSCACRRPPAQPCATETEPADLTHDWTLSVVYGPHGAPDFFTEAISRRCFPRLRGALQLGPHRRAPDRPGAQMGAHRWGRGGAASVEPA
jgi:hypothetical protein